MFLSSYPTTRATRQRRKSTMKYLETAERGIRKLQIAVNYYLKSFPLGVPAAVQPKIQARLLGLLREVPTAHVQDYDTYRNIDEIWIPGVVDPEFVPHPRPNPNREWIDFMRQFALRLNNWAVREKPNKNDTSPAQEYINNMSSIVQKALRQAGIRFKDGSYSKPQMTVSFGVGGTEKGWIYKLYTQYDRGQDAFNVWLVKVYFDYKDEAMFGKAFETPHIDDVPVENLADLYSRLWARRKTENWKELSYAPAGFGI